MRWRRSASTSRVKISDRAHIVFPYHVERDKANEAARSSAIGTTGRGIGPAYVDRVARTGIRFDDLLSPDELERKVRANASFDTGAPRPAQDDIAVRAPQDDTGGGVLARTLGYAQRLRPHIVDGVAYIQQRLAADKRILLEGAQGALLDVGYGTYPYVTSSHTIAGGACTGLGIGPATVGRVIGVLKAYTTRVGAGPFPSELHDERGERLRRQGGEYGTVTGRPRRCGWLDAVAARYAVAINGLSAAVLTKLDVLTGFERIGIVTGYRSSGKPATFGEIERPDLEVEVEELSGWSEPLGGFRRIADLPIAARAYVERVVELLGVPVELVSVGRERTQLAR